MPNWTYNELRFQSENDCKKVAQLMKSNDSEFDFNNVIPMPSYLTNIPGFSTEQHVCALAYAFSKGKKITENEMETAIKKDYPQIQDVAQTPALDSWYEQNRQPYVLSKDDVITLTRVANSHDYEQEITNYTAFDDNNPKTYAEYAELVKRAIFETGSFDWYSWSNRHWGTKWNANYPKVDIPAKRIYWETAWGPTPKIVVAIHEITNVPMYYIYTEEQITAFAGEMILKQQTVATYSTDNPRKCAQLAVFMGVIDPNMYRMSYGEYIIGKDDTEWDSAEKIIPKATLEKEFLNI